MARASTRKTSWLSPIAIVRRNGLYKGLLGGQRGWLIAGSVVFVFGRLRRFFGKQPELVATEVLKPGQAIRLEAIKPLTRRERKALRAKR